MQTESRQRLRLALAATELGRGQLRVRARAVLCPERGAGDCRALVQHAEAEVAVGPITN